MQTLKYGMEDLTRHYQPGNHFPLLQVKAADWIDIRAKPIDGTVEAVMAADEDVDVEALCSLLERYDDDYEVVVTTREEANQNIVAMMNRNNGPMPIYRHIAVLMIYTEALKRDIDPLL